MTITVKRFGDYVASLERPRSSSTPSAARTSSCTTRATSPFANGLELVEDEGLLEEVSGLVR